MDDAWQAAVDAALTQPHRSYRVHEPVWILCMESPHVPFAERLGPGEGVQQLDYANHFAIHLIAPTD